MRGAAFGLRQSLDTVGAFLGPVLAVVLMLLWSNDIRAVFWVAVIPAVLAVTLLLFGVREPKRSAGREHASLFSPRQLAGLGSACGWVVSIGAMFALARFSEAFLILRAQDAGIHVAWLPLVLIIMNLVYASSAYPFRRLSDVVSHKRLLGLGLVVLLGADVLLATAGSWPVVLSGVALWGLHMGITQGLLTRMVAGE
jgi:MFS family permease